MLYWLEIYMYFILWKQFNRNLYVFILWNLYVFILWKQLFGYYIFPFDGIYMFLFHVENERIFHRVTSYNRKS